ncbi:hypothetical protein KC19_5G142000 [Ceratodon purpureus]|uniref:UDP N-acetylglucosamine O-acyltransferase C-terminal domain-containing protein n=1 Tax=Ceratodon purpureus TaxID=3225 RepID=A0A8T0I385_CERPU|nr:hypothetical protein KC19_5G142000 [Ceratodon purpureus]
MQVVKNVVADSVIRRRKPSKVSQLLELQFRIPGSWANDARGAFSRNYIWPPWDQVCSSYISDLPNSAGAFRCSSQVERLQDIGSAMASQVFSNGSLLGGVTCSAMPGSPSAQRSSLSLLVPTSSSRNLSSGMPMVSQRGLFEKQRLGKRGMVSRAVAEPDFSEKTDGVQTENMLPLSRSNKGDAVSTSMMDAALTSVIPECKFIHETAIVHPNAFIGEGVVISAFCTVGPGVSIGRGTKLHPGSHICGDTELGEDCEVMNGAVVGADILGRTVIGNHNTIGYHAVVGVKCQDMKFKEGDECYLHIGNNNDIREYVSIHRSAKSNDCTVIGDDNLIMGSCHVAHDCKLGNHNILANGTLIGGHVVLEDYIHTGGAVAIHQYCHIDSYSFLAGGSMVTRDVPMYMMVSGDRAELRGLNLEGMRRLGFSDLEVKSIRRTYQKLFMNSDTEAGSLVDRLSDLEANEEVTKVPAVVAMLRSVRNCFGEKRRGICAFRHWTSA